MRIQESDIQDIRILELSGQLDNEIADSFAEYLNRTFTEHKKVILNFSDVDLIDRSGLAALVNSVRCADKNVSVRITCLQLIPRKQLILTDAVQYFDVYEDMDSAIQSLL